MEVKINGLSSELLAHPGATLQEVLDENNMSQRELSLRLGCTPKHTNEVIKGVKPITNTTACKLETIFPYIKANFWNTLQKNYDEQQEKIRVSETVTVTEINLVRKHKELIEFLVNEGYLKESKNDTQRVLQYREFLKLNDLAAVPELLELPGAYRIATNAKINEFALVSWLRMCEEECSFLEVEDFKEENKETLIKDSNEIRQLQLLDIKEFYPKLQKYFAKLGIAFIITKSIKDVPVNGYVKRIGNRVNLCLTNRGKDSDKFWFTLFHEIGHIIYCNLDSHFVDFDDQAYNPQELVADKFANLTLIDEDEYSNLVSNPITKEAVIELAKKQNILPGVIVGRLQHDGYLMFNQMNELKTKYIL